MQKFKIIFTIVIMFTGITTYSQPSAIDSKIALMNRAFNLKNDSILIPQLAEDFSVSSYMGSAAIFSLGQIIRNYKLDALTLTKVQKQDSVLIAEVKISGGKDSTTKFYFNKQNQLLRADLIDNLYGMDRNKEAIKLATIPFENHNGSIVLLISLNDSKRKLRFLFDTGADGMMINTALADTLGLKVSKEQKASVVGGNIDIKVSENNTVHLNDFDLPHQSIAIFGNVNPDHDGIIGNTIVKKYITQIDYEKKEMILYSLGKFSSPKNTIKIPVATSTGNILLDATVTMQNDKPILGKFTFDTGAAYDIIVFRPTVLKHKMLVSGFVADSTGSTLSMGIATPVFHGKAKTVKFTPSWKLNNFPITLMGASPAGANWNPEAAGSLGIKFISKYNFTINLVDRYIGFEERLK